MRAGIICAYVCARDDVLTRLVAVGKEIELENVDDVADDRCRA
jgi:hypothetical protein